MLLLLYIIDESSHAYTFLEIFFNFIFLYIYSVYIEFPKIGQIMDGVFDCLSKQKDKPEQIVSGLFNQLPFLIVGYTLSVGILNLTNAIPANVRTNYKSISPVQPIEAGPSI